MALFHRGLWTPDEPREYDIACNMLQTGDLVVPRLAGTPFLEKPPLSYWTEAASMHFLGPSVAAARLPNLFWAVLTVFCVSMLAHDMASPKARGRVPLLAALLCATTLLTLQVQTWLSTDAPLLGMTAAALASGWRLAHAKTSQQEFAWSLLLGLGLAGTFLAKNGFGMLVPVAALLSWHAAERQLHRLLRWPWWVASGWFGLFAGSWLLALAWREGGNEHLHALLWDNLVARALPVHSDAGYDLGHRNTHWSALALLAVYVLPWTFALVAAARWGIRVLRTTEAQASAVRFCIAAFLPAYVAFLLSRTARDVYFAPTLLGLQVLLALWLASEDEKLSRSDRRLLLWTRWTLQIFAALVAGTAATMVAVIGIDLTSVALLMVLIPVLLTGTHLAVRMSRGSARGLVASTGSFLLALGIFEIVAFPRIDRGQNLRALVVAAAPTLKNPRIAMYCGDETIRATLDYAVDLRLQEICTLQDAEHLLLDHPDQQFFVETAAPSPAQRLGELFPELARHRSEFADSSRARRTSELAALGLRPVARWSVPGGRKYAVYAAPGVDTPAGARLIE